MNPSGESPGGSRVTPTSDDLHHKPSSKDANDLSGDLVDEIASPVSYSRRHTRKASQGKRSHKLTDSRFTSELSLDVESFKQRTSDSLPSMTSGASSSSGITVQECSPVPEEQGQGGVLRRSLQSTRQILTGIVGRSSKSSKDASTERIAARLRRKRARENDVTSIVDNDVARALISEDDDASCTVDAAFAQLIEEQALDSEERAIELQAVLDELLHQSDKLEEHHGVFFRVVQNIFHKEEPTEMAALPYATSFLDVQGRQLRTVVEHVIEHSAFNAFVFGLTLYALFGPDFADSLCNPDVKDVFVAFNTVAFVAFAFELVALCVAKNQYYCTLPFFLDTVSLLSMWSLTWFMRSTAWSNGQFSFGTIARSSRMLRLARLARVARLTRMLPGVFHAFRRSQLILAWHIVRRRLWRCFLVLDPDQDKFVSSFELRFVYAALMQECGHMLEPGTDKLSMMKQDAQLLKESEPNTQLSFDEFSEVFLSTRFGKAIRMWHLAEVEEDQSVWKLTSLISDSMSRKVCLGALILVAMLQVLEIPVRDSSLLMGLETLQLMAVASHGGDFPNATSVICKQLDLMISLQKDRSGDVLYIMLNGYSYWYDDECQSVPLSTDTVDPVGHAESLVDRYALASPSGVFWLGGTDMEEATSMVVVDRSAATCAEAASSMLYTACVILLLLLFIILLNAGLATFSKKLLQPLRTLVDDMTALSCLELVQVDEELTTQRDIRSVVGVPEELHDLETSFKSMHNAIQSWSKYAPPNVVKSLFNAGVEAKIGVLRCDASILFCDVVDFEDACKGLSPPEVLTLLTNVLGKVAEVIQSHGGTLLEFIGDEVLAVFNTPRQMPHHGLAAARSALEIQRAIASLPELVANDGRVVEVKCRCGVHTASILAGNIGSHQRMKYGLLGDGINLTARLKGLNSRYRPPSRTIASQAVANDPSCRRQLLCRPVDLVAVKGKKEPTTVYEIAWNDSTPKMQATILHEAAFKQYQMREFEQAKVMFDRVHTLMEEGNVRDEPSRLLSARCAKYIEEPPPDSWDGVDRLTKKTFDPPPPADESPAPEKPTSAAASPDMSPTLGVTDTATPLASAQQSGLRAAAAVVGPLTPSNDRANSAHAALPELSAKVSSMVREMAVPPLANKGSEPGRPSTSGFPSPGSPSRPRILPALVVTTRSDQGASEVASQFSDAVALHGLTLPGSTMPPHTS